MESCKNLALKSWRCPLPWPLGCPELLYGPGQGALGGLLSHHRTACTACLGGLILSAVPALARGSVHSRVMTSLLCFARQVFFALDIMLSLCHRLL